MTSFRPAAFVAALVLAFLGAAALAQGVLPVPPLSGRVVDQTATLTPPQVAALDAKLAAIEQKNGSQVVVLIVPTTQPEDIASFAQRVGEQWKIGRKVEGDGLLLTVAKNDRAVEIHVAKALQGAVPDIAASRIIREQIVPAFRAGDYAGGLNSAVDRLGERIAGEGLPAPAEQPAAGRPRGRGFNIQDIAIFLFVGVPIVGGVLRRVMGRKLGALVTGVGVGAIGWFLTASLLVAAGAGVVALFLVGIMGLSSSRGGGGLGGPIIFGGGGGGFGGGFSGGSSGGFSSGGGGSFDGGGASGAVVMQHWLARLVRHRLFDEGDTARALGQEALERIGVKVAASERRHSGEIRVMVEAGLPTSYLRRNAVPRERAVAMFGKLRVWDTERNNGVLVYLLLAERAIEIVADRGLNRHVDPAAWAAITAQMQERFRGGDFEAGLGHAIDAIDALLVRHFPAVAGETDVNELPDAPLMR